MLYVVVTTGFITNVSSEYAILPLSRLDDIY